MKKRLFDLFKKKEADDGEMLDENGKFEEIVKQLSKYFTTEPEKERVLRYEDFDAAGDTHFAVVAARYKICQRLSLIALVLFLLVSLIFNVQNLTFDNFFYLVKDLEAAAENSVPSYETLTYDVSSEQSFALYRGGLAVVSRSNVSSFTASGRRTLNNNVSYSNPYVVSSDKYLLVYDMGGGGFEIFNSFAKVYSESTEYPISDAVFAGDGKFAILTRSEEHESQIIVYNADFKRLSSYSKNLFAIDISLDKEGRRLGAAYVGTENGIVSTHVVFYDVKNSKKTHEYVYEGEFPLACSFSENGGFSLVTDSSVIIFDKNLTQEYVSASYSDKSVSALFCDGEYTAVATNNGVITDISDVIIFDKQGQLVYNGIVESSVEEIAVAGGYFFVKGSGEAHRIKIKDSSFETLECKDGKMVLYDSGTLLICSQSKAVYLDFEN